MTHGLAGTYSNGRYKCRCDECRAANARRGRRERAERRERLVANPGLAEHGNASTYKNWGCRCQPCSQAHKAALAAYRATR